MVGTISHPSSGHPFPSPLSLSLLSLPPRHLLLHGQILHGQPPSSSPSFLPDLLLPAPPRSASNLAGHLISLSSSHQTLATPLFINSEHTLPHRLPPPRAPANHHPPSASWPPFLSPFTSTLPPEPPPSPCTSLSPPPPSPSFLPCPAPSPSASTPASSASPLMAAPTSAVTSTNRMYPSL